MQFIDLAKQQSRIKDKIDANIQTVMKHGSYIMGPEIKALEKRLADYVGIKHAIGCSSGTDYYLLDTQL
jgi:UDP-2-acetamido-2-deoxy-ribo-hexuluronate aminotransferase